jgi:hypothetical protein
MTAGPFAHAFTFVFREDDYSVTVRRTAAGVEVRDSDGIARLVSGPARGVLAGLRGLCALGRAQIAVCAAAADHLSAAPFTRDHEFTVLPPMDTASFNGARFWLPSDSEVWKRNWDAAEALGPL